ncbi:hypothetical protein [Streptomyces sp. NPDC093225]|uniref:hypothetical protein n=1 Tax=Streptomyces sp. NPDC093225 TaxID=3366034 RepID=UPI00381F5BBF
MSTHPRTVAVRAVAVTALAASVLALPASVALADTSTAEHRTAHTRHTPLPLTASRGAAERAVKPAHSVDSVARKPVKTVYLADGVSTATVYRTGTAGYQADIAAGGAPRRTLRSTNGTAAHAVAVADGLYVALGPDGRVSSWVNDAAPDTGPDPTTLGTPLRIGADGHKTAHRAGAVVVAKPLAAVQAGMKSLRPGVAAGPDAGPGDGVLMIGAGAGMAAVGAAGLGFAMLRRGRTYGVRD